MGDNISPTLTPRQETKADATKISMDYDNQLLLNTNHF
jgi:hypothetical protein